MEIGYHDNNSMSALYPFISAVEEKGIRIEHCPLPSERDSDLPQLYIINPTFNEENEEFFKKVKIAAQTNPQKKFIFYMPTFSPEPKKKAQKTIGTLPNLEFLFKNGPERLISLSNELESSKL